MRKDGRGHGDHDDDPGPTRFGTIGFVAVLIVLGWWIAGAPGLW